MFVNLQKMNNFAVTQKFAHIHSYLLFICKPYLPWPMSITDGREIDDSSACLTSTCDM